MDQITAALVMMLYCTFVLTRTFNGSDDRGCYNRDENSNLKTQYSILLYSIPFNETNIETKN